MKGRPATSTAWLDEAYARISLQFSLPRAIADAIARAAVAAHRRHHLLKKCGACTRWHPEARPCP